MIFDKPIMGDLSLLEWLREGGFPPGIVELAEKALKEKVEAPGEILAGYLIYVVRGEEGRGERNIGRLLAALHPYAETVVFSPASKVLSLNRRVYRLPQDEDGRDALDMMEEADVLVLSGASYLSEEETHQVDSFVANRAHGAPRITILLVEDKKLKLPQAEEIYWKRQRWV